MPEARDKPSDVLNTHEVTELLHIHPNTVRKWAHKGYLKCFRIGPRGDRRFLRSDIEALMKVGGSND